MKHLLSVFFVLFATFTIGCGEASDGQYTPVANSDWDEEHGMTIDDYTAAIRLDQYMVSAWASYNRGVAWAEAGEHDKAIDDHTEAIRLNPDNSESFYNRGSLWRRKHEYPKAISDYTTSIKVNPQFLESLNQLAWIQATCSDAGFRNGKQALEYATKACEQTEWKDAGFLDTLAAAYAEAGDFEKAVEWQTKAMNLAPEEEKADYRSRLELYESGKPYRDEQGV